MLGVLSRCNDYCTVLIALERDVTMMLLLLFCMVFRIVLVLTWVCYILVVDCSKKQ